jgi:hypothetical protein
MILSRVWNGYPLSLGINRGAVKVPYWSHSDRARRAGSERTRQTGGRTGTEAKGQQR